MCCVTQVYEKNGGLPQVNYGKKKACTTITNSPAVIVPNDPGATLVVQPRPKQFAALTPSPTCTDQEPLNVGAVGSSDERLFYGWQPLECSVNGTAIDPDLNDVATLEAQFYACETNDILHTATGTNLSPPTAPPGQFLSVQQTNICCRIRACDGGVCGDFISQEYDFDLKKGAAKVEDSPTLVEPASIAVQTDNANSAVGFSCESEAFDCDLAQVVNQEFVFNKTGTQVPESGLSYNWTIQSVGTPTIELQTTDPELSVSEADLSCGASVSCAVTAKIGVNANGQSSEPSQPVSPFNQPPEVLTVQVESNLNPTTTLSTLTCNFDGVIDPEGQLNEVRVTWERNQAPIAGRRPS